MRKVLIALVVVAVVVGGLGFWRGWFVLSGSSPSAGDNQFNVNLSVDPDKARADAEAIQTKTTDLTGKVADEAQDLEDAADDKVRTK